MSDTLAQPAARKTTRRHRSPNGPGLWVTEGELIEMMGVPPDVARARIAEMDTKAAVYAFPQRVKEWGDRRYRPAIEAWFEHRYGLKIGAPSHMRRVS